MKKFLEKIKGKMNNTKKKEKKNKGFCGEEKVLKKRVLNNNSEGMV